MRKQNEKISKIWKIFQKLGKKVDFKEGKGAPFTHITPITPLFGRANDTYDTQHSKNHEKARQKQPINYMVDIIGYNTHHSKNCWVL